MTSFFSTAFINALSATPGMINGSTVKCVLFREAPAFEPNDSRYIGKTTVSQLLSMPGWIPVASGGAPLANTITVGVRDEGKSNYVMFSSFPFTGLTPNEAKAAVFLRADNTIIFGTNTPFGGEMRVVKDGDAITASPDANLVGASNRWLYSWADAPQAGGTIVTISEGPLLLSLGPPDFEPAHTQHVWLYPQRANMIANPSFEKSSPPTGYWSSNGTVTRVPLVNPPIAAGRFAGRFQYAGIVVAESNTFPTMREEYWTIQFMARGLGDMKVAFVYWDDDFEAASVDWGEETWRLDPDTFIHIAVCRFPVQTYQGMLRIEATGGDLTIDQVLCEVGFLKDWPYFDGDSDYGMREDFTWYGGEVRQGGTYSLWYNHKRAVFGRMFARQVADDELVTDEVVAAQGISYGWVPAGTNVTPHMDVLYPNDLQLPVPDKPAGVLSYRIAETDIQGIVYPWGLFVHPGLHAHSASYVTLEVFLQVQNGVHVHTAANVTIVAVPNTAMVPANATHAHTAANISLTQINVTQPDTAVHSITSPEITMALGGPALPVTSGLFGWWDADDASTISLSVGTVYQWRDKTAAKILQQISSALAGSPNGVQNGRKTIIFDGVDDYMDSYTGTFTLTQPFTIFMMLDTYADTDGDDTQSFIGTNPSSTGTFQVYSNTPYIMRMFANTVTPELVATNSFEGVHAWRFVFNGATSTMHRDGVQQAAGTIGTTGATRLRIAADRTLTAGSYFHGEIMEILIYSRVLTAPEVTQVDTYLNNKWITIPPP